MLPLLWCLLGRQIFCVIVLPEFSKKDEKLSKCHLPFSKGAISFRGSVLCARLAFLTSRFCRRRLLAPRHRKQLERSKPLSTVLLNEANNKQSSAPGKK